VRSDALRRIQQLAQYGRLTALRQCTGLSASNAPNAGFAMVNLAASLADSTDNSRFSKAMAMLPAPPEAPEKAARPPSQTVLLTDNGTAITGAVRGAAHLDHAKSVHAYFLVKGLKVAATEVAVVNGDGLNLTFPTLQGFVQPSAKDALTVEVEVDSHSFPLNAQYRRGALEKTSKASAHAKKTDAAAKAGGKAGDQSTGKAGGANKDEKSTAKAESNTASHPVSVASKPGS
jgi:hypothetical protein